METLFTAGANYADLITLNRIVIGFQLHLAMNEFQQVESSGDYKKALNPISQDELDSVLQRTFGNSKELTKALEKAYEKTENLSVPLSIMLERELPNILIRERMVGRYRSGYEPVNNSV